MKITIKNEDVELKFNFRTEIIFEEAMGKSFMGTSTSEWVFHMFACVLANTNETFIDFVDFTDWLSANPLIFYEYIDMYAEQQKTIAELRNRNKAAKKKSKEKKVKEK